MNKADDRPEPKWWPEFEGIAYPQWGSALVWRALMRWLPFAFATDPQEEPQPEVTELASGALKILMRYPFVLDLAYRSQRSNADPRQAAVVQQFQKLVQRIETLNAYMANLAAPSLRQLFQDISAMLQAGSNARPAQSQKAMQSLSIAVPQSMRSSWDESVEIDLRALHPLTEEKADDLQEFLASPLWPGNLNRDIPGRRDLRFPDSTLEDPESIALFDVLLFHQVRPLAWTKLIVLLISRSDDQTLTPDQAVQIEAISSDPVRLATLLSRMALNDRTRLDLAAAPSVAGFREALDKRGMQRAELPVLEQRLASEQQGFLPNPTWLAWVQTVHRPGIENILAELKSWLPSAKATPDSEQPKPSIIEPENARPSVRNAKSAKRPNMKKS